MRKRLKSLIASCVLTLVASIGLSQQGVAAVLYEDGSTLYGDNSEISIWAYQVTDSFTLSAASVVTGVVFTAWTYGIPTSAASVNWEITSTVPNYNSSNPPVGTNITLTTPSSGMTNGSWTVREYTFSTGSIPLSAGTYYLTLDNGLSLSAPNYDIGWDINSGPSVAYDNGELYPYAESFEILGTQDPAAPLPSTWTMMLIGLVGLGFVAYRRQKEDTTLAAA